MTETPTPKSKPFYLRLLPWLSALLLLLCLVAACEPFVAQYRAIKVLRNKRAYVELEAPRWLPEFIESKLSEEQTFYVYEVVGVVDLYRTFSDGDMIQLSRFTHLRSLRLSNSKVTRKGMKKLQQALPNCEIKILDLCLE